MNSLNKLTVLSCHNLVKEFGRGISFTKVLNRVNINVIRGERVAIIGASGSGKSTLMHLLGGLDTPTSGSVHLLGKDITVSSEKIRNALRNKKLGFVYQFHHLLPEFSALDNVAMPLMIRRVKYSEAKEHARRILTRVNLVGRMTSMPSELSGGEKQRIALARALVTEPACVLADEPTGNLDHESAKKVFELIQELSQTLGMAFVIATHDIELAYSCDRILHLSERGLESHKDLDSSITNSYT